MINDKDLHLFLSKNEVSDLTDIDIVIGNQGERLSGWQMRFNQLNSAQMYSQYQTAVRQLMQANISEQKRLELFENLHHASERLLASLHLLYRNQAGILSESQQQALDIVLSVYYLGVMFYNSVWQRIVHNPQLVEKKGFGSLLGFGNSNNKDDMIKHCLYGMMSFLRQALFEKQIGYRKDTQVIWQWLNTCYHFMLGSGWQSFSYHLPLIGQSGMNGSKPLTLQAIYYQCLLSEVVNPYGCRRPDIIMWQKFTNEFVNDLIVSDELVEKPYLFINLKSNEPPTLLQPQMAFNPFAQDSSCLFLGFSKLTTALKRLMEKGKNGDTMDDKVLERFAKIMLENLQKNLVMPEMLGRTNLKCQAVGGFYHIHYMLANKTSLGNLIQANTLPERLRPKGQNSAELNKSTLANLVEANARKYHLNSEFGYLQTSDVHSHSLSRSNDHGSTLRYLQVGSMVATRLVDDPNKVWQLGRISSISQSTIEQQSFENNQVVKLNADVRITLIGKGIIPCGIRLYNAGNRPQHFVPAMMIPKNEEFNRPFTSIMMARFGYQVDDKMIIRIDDKEVNIRLTELLFMTDDVEEYAFVRVQ